MLTNLLVLSLNDFRFSSTSFRSDERKISHWCLCLPKLLAELTRVNKTPYQKSLVRDEISKDNTTATIYNMMGMVVGSKTLNTSYTSQTINTNTLVSGIYIIKIAAGNQVFSKKIYVK